MGNESLSFELRLVDSVTSVARKQAAAVKSVETSANKAQLALGKQFEKIGFAAARSAKKQEDAFAASWAKIGMAAERARIRQEKAIERAAEKKKEHSFMAGIHEATGISRLATASFLGDLAAEGAVKIVESLVEGAKMVVEIISDGIKDAFKAAGREQTQRIGEKNALGIGATGFREDIDRFAKNTPFDDSEVRKLMLPLRRAGLSQAASRQAFATATDIGGPDAGAVGGILDQFKHIYTKRGIGKKQLVELLGNVGSTIPDFYKALGKEMHISAKAAEKKAEEGGLDPQLIMNMITAAQNKKQGGAAGTGALEYAKSLEGRWKKITELPEEYYKKLVDSPGFARASEMLGSLLEKLDPESPTGKRIMGDIERAFDKITNALGGGEDGVDGIVDGIENMIGLVSDIIPDLKIMGQLLMSSAETVADIIRGARVFIALQTGDTKGAGAILQEQAIADGQKKVRKFQEENERSEKAQRAAEFAGAFLGGGGVLLPSAKPVKTDSHWGDAPQVNIHLHGDHKNPEDAGRKAGRAAARELERARLHGGG